MKQDPYHEFDDVDASKFAHHHTIGPGPNQAAAGNHSHQDYEETLEELGTDLGAIEGSVRIGSISVTGDGTNPLKTATETFDPAYSLAYSIPRVILVTTHSAFHAAITGTTSRTSFSVSCRRLDNANWTNIVPIHYIAYATRV